MVPVQSVMMMVALYRMMMVVQFVLGHLGALDNLLTVMTVMGTLCVMKMEILCKTPSGAHTPTYLSSQSLAETDPFPPSLASAACCLVSSKPYLPQVSRAGRSPPHTPHSPSFGDLALAEKEQDRLARLDKVEH